MFVLLGGGCPTPLKNTGSSVGMMKFPIYGNSENSCSKPPNRLHLMDVIPNYPHEPVRSYSYYIDIP
jgi:hypothetical protein